MIAIVDYGLGNVQAFLDIYKRLNLPAMAVREAKDLPSCDQFILPGVGAFDWAMHSLEASGMRPVLTDLVVHQRRPLLGVCVGMQMLASRSAEGVLPGLGWIAGEIRQFAVSDFQRLPHLPHMGWNDVVPEQNHPLFLGIKAPQFYFLHSYYFAPSDPACVIGTTDYGKPFAAAVAHGHIYGTQFHPEKSHDWGMRLLHNFAILSAC